jgi:hypothetical protein
MNKKPIALIAAGALLASPVALLVAAPAHADIERSGIVDGGRWEFNIDSDDGRFEVNADLDNVTPGSRWKVVLRQDGKRILKRTVMADDEGDLDVQRTRPNTTGKDVFVLIATQVGSNQKVRSSITR